MSETTPPPKPRTKKTEVIEDAVVVEETPLVSPPEATAPPVTVPPTVVEPQPEPVAVQEPEPVAPQQPEPVVAPEPQYVYVHTPPPPARKGNRGVGIAIAAASALIFFVVFIVIVAFINLSRTGEFSFDFLANGTIYLPVLFFLLGFAVVVVLANRANWWAYILGSILVALVVYFGTIGAVMLTNNVILRTPEEAAAMFAAGLVDPIVITAALLAREVSLWTGALIARRGRRVTARNVEARAAWEREVADTKAQYERTAYPAP
ncbi:hypothetical protein M2152_000082 [Microbacteriaceae bacterium SG_E_30_P1]|uniref:Uncharacterized protein n=1 Tax=Antiquaquibacter oligotrophicus TaxID=2880260 RepID=A0ABT6KJ37_9MICO|nr:hypothetical protein [Antiquaquibacter oligotrophicus]MDH6179900.1 hypothetical protein [Antiquaquibacter oligotrophicus]UDF14340.1 hypothetical protein LH407_05615 [Antiquaquibacter oligotrophicus]